MTRPQGASACSAPPKTSTRSPPLPALASHILFIAQPSAFSAQRTVFSVSEAEVQHAWARAGRWMWCGWCSSCASRATSPCSSAASQ
eukprot:2973093-Rhodomonas_salina.4